MEDVGDAVAPTDDGLEIENWLYQDRDDIVGILGPPDEEQAMHSMEMIYQEHQLMVFYDGNTPDNQVTGVSLYQESGYRYRGTGLGMTFAQIQDRLGEPQSIGFDEMSAKYLMMYHFDDIEAYYFAENEGAPVDQLSVFNKNRQ